MRRLGRIVFIGSEYLAIAFSLIGIETHTAFDVIDAEKLVSKAVERDDVDILVITEDLYLELSRRYVRFKKEDKNKPILMIVPPLTGPLGKRTEDLYNLISQAVGVRLELGR